jgi:TRAP-type C4-dicarboxylate transport system substrate-binding protein
MGAVATADVLVEVYPGIEQKVIDGCEAQTPTVYASHIYEVSKYINKTETLPAYWMPCHRNTAF